MAGADRARSKPRRLRAGSIGSEITARIAVKVGAGASQSCIVGWSGEALRVRVAAPRERGKANAAVESLLALALGLPKGAVSVRLGKTSARKLIEIAGLSQAEVDARLAAHVAAAARAP